MPFISPLSVQLPYAWWSGDGRVVYHLRTVPDQRTLRLYAVDATTGAVRCLIEERADTRIEATQQPFSHPPMVRLLAGDTEAVWYSQRAGRGHLYRYDLRRGEVINQITAGGFAVQQILHLDETAQVIYLLVSGLVPADPYRRSLLRVGLDGDTPARLSTDDLDHDVIAAPHGRWFVDAASTVDTPPVTQVVDRDGATMLELERADIARLVATGWTPPERTRTVAADGTTPIYGLLYKPPEFDPARRYPVVEHVYPGPQRNLARPSFGLDEDAGTAEAVAALGFVVVVVDGRGTPGRDKAFHDHTYPRLLAAAGGLEDHVAALRQLAGTRPWMDLNRVGIVGHSGGGYATARAMLRFPDVYRVGVASSGNHDQRSYNALWGCGYDGPYDPQVYAESANTELAGNLRGHLLLVHGAMDDNVNVAQTMRLADRLIEANKDFDLLIVPGAEHSYAGYLAYVLRRRWDYLVRHLLDTEPPAGYRLADIPLPAELPPHLS
jgi:dipeptidyl aminopeptidase/acylaminoacyl peptidase